MLYRVPRRLLARKGAAPSTLDMAHPAPAFEPVQVRVQETYRKRSIECITYLASEQATQPFAVFPAEQRRLDSFRFSLGSTMYEPVVRVSTPR